MIWGCTGGLVAGLFGGTLAEIVHVPTKILLWWVDAIASRSALAPPATLDRGSLAVIGALCAAAVGLRSRPPSGIVLGAAVLGVLSASYLTAPTPAPGVDQVGHGVTLIHSESSTVVVLDDPTSARRVLERVRLSGTGAPDLVIVRDGDRADADAVVGCATATGRSRSPRRRCTGCREGRTVSVGQVIEVDMIRVRIDEVQPRLEITVIENRP